MAKIAYILLCHKDPEAIIEQATRLTAAGDCMAIHFDASAPIAHFDEIHDALKDNPNVVFAKKRINCGWGEWSLVQATLNAIKVAEQTFPRATHFYMLSSDCAAIKSAEYIHNFLDDNDADFIESFDYFSSDWIKTGWKEERLIYRHYFNERTQPKRFYAMFNVQQKLGLTRDIPADLQIMIGSQWWCLRRRTIEWVLDFCRDRPDVMKFFRTTWIPDETFFQTLVRHLVSGKEIRSRTLTFLMFSDYGMPLTFYNDHYDLLLSQDFLFARKISPQATELKTRLGELYAAKDTDFQISNEGPQLFKFLTGSGRQGRRYAKRFWEAKSTFGRDHELLIVTCKKWHVAKRLVRYIKDTTNIPVIEYLFDEMGADLPDLGGIQSSLAKRGRHHRALVRMLFEAYESTRLIICLDPRNFEQLRDFYADRSKTRLLEIKCEFSDDYLTGHAQRIGLIGEHASRETLDRLLPTMYSDLQFEADQIVDAEFENFFRLEQAATRDENAATLAQFLDIGPDKAKDIELNEHLFSD